MANGWLPTIAGKRQSRLNPRLAIRLSSEGGWAPAWQAQQAQQAQGVRLGLSTAAPRCCRSSQELRLQQLQAGQDALHAGPVARVGRCAR